ncbi:hypothetical protein [Phormidesmis sp. 146-33]
MSANPFSIHTATVCQPDRVTATMQLSQGVNGRIISAHHTKQPIQGTGNLEQLQSGRCGPQPALT